jgi:hypothetical protein
MVNQVTAQLTERNGQQHLRNCGGGQVELSRPTKYQISTSRKVEIRIEKWMRVFSPEMEENDGGLLGDVLNPGTEAGIAEEEDPAGRAVAPADPSSRCWVMSRRRL